MYSKIGLFTGVYIVLLIFALKQIVGTAEREPIFYVLSRNKENIYLSGENCIKNQDVNYTVLQRCVNIMNRSHAVTLLCGRPSSSSSYPF